jgi:hypothetical protein
LKARCPDPGVHMKQLIRKMRWASAGFNNQKAARKTSAA